MNILKKELKTGLKPFIFWSIGLFFLVFAGVVKFTGISGVEGASVKELFDKFPKIILALFGMAGLDATAIDGYYGILAFYALICGMIYGVSLGTNIINREVVDKTFEFIFTKPRKRSYIVNMKFISATIYLAAFSLLNYTFSIVAIRTLDLEKNIDKEILLFSLAIFIISMLYCVIGIFIATVIKNYEKGNLYGNLFFFVTFILSIIYDVVENGSIIRIFTPFKYLLPTDIVNGKFETLPLIACIVIIVALYIVSLKIFERKEFSN
ncbi:ABC transporter permease subunit [Clostridium gasigenes]|uniref:ABC transporter permease subunit n=1 Tax=Clostridium gasigenes TaxID=94869 RepID=A0A7X0SA94_9CLOT|nr:ABC transporter permease subunit [Clostridium gasigenes]MBB6713900.1 ABC transporter permease subunit [Clostridium gasigenes]